MAIIMHLGFMGFLMLLGLMWFAVMVAACFMKNKEYEDAEYEKIE